MRLSTVLLMFLLVALLSSFSSARPDDHTAVVNGNNAFAVELYKQVISDDPASPANTFFSPFSISVALAMTLMGAEGETADEMCATLNLPSDKNRINTGFRFLTSSVNATGREGPCELSSANALWGQKYVGFLPSFTEQIAEYYDGHFQELDFRAGPEDAMQVINQWVSLQTRERGSASPRIGL